MRVFADLFLFVVAMCNLSGVAMEDRRPDLSYDKYQPGIAPNDQWMSRSKRNTVSCSWRMCTLVCGWRYTNRKWHWGCWWDCQATGGRRKRSVRRQAVPVALDYNSWTRRCPNGALNFNCFVRNNDVRVDVGSRQAFCGADRDRNGIVSQQEFYKSPWLFEGMEDGAPLALKLAARSLTHRYRG